MRTVVVQYHPVSGETEGISFPADDLVKVFRASGIVLTVERGSPVSLWDAIRIGSIRQRWRAMANSVGHVILGTRYGGSLAGGFPIAGQLLDTVSRGIAIIYSRSTYFLSNRESRLLQTAAHEIGHMLNLGHGDVTADFVSTMESASHRDADTKKAWTLARDEADRKAKQGHDPYFHFPASLPSCHPFAFSARVQLNTMAEQDLQPWGGPFRSIYEGANDRFN